MFSAYEEAILLEQFSEGKSGSHVFLVRPVKSNGPELRSVVKVDFAEAIQQEWQAYEHCIQHKLPRTAVIHGSPIYPPGSKMGGLWYSLAGDGIVDIVSLAAYVREASIPKVESVLKRLLQSMDGMWKLQMAVETELHLHAAYDSFLPANLFIEAVAPPLGKNVHSLRPEKIKTRQWAVGDYVYISGFYPTEIDRQLSRVLLDTNESGPFRFYLQAVPDIDVYEIDQKIGIPVCGQIKQTRHGFLQEKVAEVLGSMERANKPLLTSADGKQIPNPLLEMETILARSFEAHTSCVHGDLHPRNILVDVDSSEVYLIDFGKSGRDYIMRDLLHLEMNIITEILAENLPVNGRLPDVIYAFYKTLHCAIVHSVDGQIPSSMLMTYAMLVRLRKTARHYLFKADQWEEYYAGLCLHLLGALKYGSLTDTGKQVAFWGSAAILQLMQDPPTCQPISTTPSSLSVSTWKVDVGSGVTAVSLSANGTRIAAATLGKMAICFDGVGQLLWRRSVGNQAWRVGLSSDGETAVVGSGSTRFWDMSGRGVSCFNGDGSLRWQQDLAASIWGLAVSADGSTIAVGTSAKQLLIFDGQGHLLWRQDVPGVGWYAWVWSAALSADGQVIAAGAADKHIRILEQTGKLLVAHPTRADVFATAVSADGNVIGAGDSSGSVYCLDRNGRLLWEEELADKVWGVAFSANGQRLLVGAGEKEAHIRLYNLSGQSLWKRHVGGSVTNVSISADGRRIVAGTRDGGIFIFHEDQVLYQARANKIVRDVAISAAGDRVVAGSEDGTVYGFDLTSSFSL